MSKTDNVTDFMTDLAMAIRAKEGTTDLISPQDMAQRIGAIGGKEIAKQERSNLSALLTDIADALRAVYGTTNAINPQDFASLVAGISVGDSYTPLTYIEATGAQYFSLGYVVKETDIIEMRYENTMDSNTDKFLFGATDNNGGVFVDIWSYTGYIRFGQTESTKDGGYKTDRKKLLRLQKGLFYLDFEKIVELPFVAMPEIPLAMFGRNNGTVINKPSYVKCRWWKLTDGDGNVTIDLRPVKRDSDGKVGMIDRVSGTFYVNEGTGDDFAVGEEIPMPSGYAIIDCVSFDEDRVFDAGVIKDTYTIETEFARTDVSVAKYLYGMTTANNTATVTAYLSTAGNWRWKDKAAKKTVVDTYLHVSVQTNGSVTLDGSATAFTASSAFETPYSLALGGNTNASGVMSASFIGNIYHFSISEGDIVIKDWWPCIRESDGVVGFWDRVSQKFVEPITEI